MTNTLDELGRAVERLAFETERAANVQSISATCRIDDLQVLLWCLREQWLKVAPGVGVTKLVADIKKVIDDFSDEANIEFFKKELNRVLDAADLEKTT